MALTCPRCSRVNPAEAVFCFADGASLGPSTRAHTDPGRQRFPMPFVFPSGKPCHSFDELVLACLADWTAARELLREGAFTGFLAGVGRVDLSRLARRAAGSTDPDRALNDLLACFPSTVLRPPRLVVEPRTIHLGEVRPGRDVVLQVHLDNEGMGLLTGALRSTSPWLLIGPLETAGPSKLFQFLHDTTVPIHIQGKELRAGSVPYEGSLVVESNGGDVVVPIHFNVPILPFPDGVLAGAKTPRRIAEKARDHPREAGELFASGAVARWYESNGWSYPVQEPAASGVAAVQQFFEALGLTKPPRVTINRSEVRLQGKPGEPAVVTVEITTDEKRPVWACVSCDAPWLDVRQVDLNKSRAKVHLGAQRVPNRPGERLEAKVIITSNGRQRFVLPVRLDVLGRPAVVELESVLPVEEDAPAPTLRRHREQKRERERFIDPPVMPSSGTASRLLLAAVPVLLLCLGLSVTLGRDLGALMNDRGGGRKPENDPHASLPQVLHISYHERPLDVTLAVGGSVKPGEGPGGVDARPAVWDPSMRFGLFLRHDGQQKNLTFEGNGLTNNCVIRLDGHEWIFGEGPFRDKRSNMALGRWPGRWQDRNLPLDRPMRDGRRSMWVYDNESIQVTQTVGLVPGEQSGQIDTCLVLYRIDNRDSRPHRVGLRFLLDTFIGSNDGVPFLIPGRQQLCSTSMQFNRPEEVPDFLQACEREDLANPGTVAQVRLRLAGLEPPARVTIGSWPNPSLGPPCRQEKTLWEVPVWPIKQLAQPDSAVTIYWAERDLEPGGHRVMGFAYGLGTVSSGETGGQLALTVGGNFVPGGEFTLTAYVRHPSPGQSLRLTLPEEFQLIQGGPVAGVPPLPRDGSSQVSPVTWRVKAGGQSGTYSLKVQSSTGVTQTLPVRIQVRGIFGN